MYIIDNLLNLQFFLSKIDILVIKKISKKANQKFFL